MAKSQPDFWQYVSAAESSASQLSLWLSGISVSDKWVMEAMMVLSAFFSVDQLNMSNADADNEVLVFEQVRTTLNAVFSGHSIPHK